MAGAAGRAAATGAAGAGAVAGGVVGPGLVGDHENTRCHNCGETLIKRRSYFVEEYRLTPDGRCPSCKTALPGRWSAKFEGQITDRPFLPRHGSRLVTILN